MFIKKLNTVLQTPRKRIDIVFMFAVALILLWRPAYQQQKLNLFEWGLYLPGIDAVSHSQVPYRDFFHLRGPFELYAPALFMKIFGFRADMLATYFYAGTVLTILVSLLIAWEIIEQRALLYTFILILVTRTFPRVAFTFWGGMRYAWGLLAIYCLIRFLKTRHRGWIFAGGCLAAIGAGTSIEIGVIVVFALIAALCLDRRLRQASWVFALGFLGISLPYWIYLLSQHAVMPYIQAQWVVVTNMQNIFVQLDPVPDTVPKLLHAVFCLSDKSFNLMTPLYTYLFFFLLYAWRAAHKKVIDLDRAALIVVMYGLGLFFTSFRKIGFVEYEMALQPDKIILFYLLGQLITKIGQRQDWCKWLATVLIVAVVISSAVYGMGRFKTRFYKTSWMSAFTSKHKGNTQPMTVIDLPRLKHMTIPESQAQDLEQLRAFVDRHVPKHEAVWMYPELGSLHFILDRPWVGRFPMVTLSWMNDQWFDEYDADLQAHPPMYAIINKNIATYFDKSYNSVPGNRVKQQRMIQFLNDHYVVDSQTPSYLIYRLKNT